MAKERVFILSANQWDQRGRHVLCFYGVTPSQRPVEILQEDERPVFFIPAEADLPEECPTVERRPVNLRTIDNQLVHALYFSTLREKREVEDMLRKGGIACYESDVGSKERFLMERFIFGQMEVEVPPEASVSDRSLLRLVNPRIEPAEVEPRFVVCSLDIETSVRHGTLYSVALHCTGLSSPERHVYILGEASGSPAGITFCATEAALVEALFAWMERWDPDVLIGWHVIGFDLAFLARKCETLGQRFRLGRARRTASVRQNNNGQWFADVPGRVVLDGPVALRSAFYRFEDFRLETVSQVLLGEGKHIASDENKVAEIERQYREAPLELAAYNLQDCELVTRIFEKTGILKQCVRRTQLSGMLMDQLGRSTAAFDHVFLPRLHRKGFVAPAVQDVVPQGHAAGGFVMSPTVGLHKGVVVLDFKSLYPSIIRTFKIDPYSRLVAELDPSRPQIETPVGHRFAREDHILPELIEELMAGREKAKTAKDPYLSQAIKILMNSFYGVMGSWGCRFYHPHLPSAITGTGQWLLKGCRTRLEEQGYSVLYGDTDSVFVQLKAEELADGDGAGRRLAQELNLYWRERLRTRFDVESHLEMEYEKFYRYLVLPAARGREEGAKKRYAGLRVDGEEVALDFVGMEYVRSDWTQLARTFQYDLYWKLFHAENVEDWIREVVAEVKAGRRDEELVYHKRLRKDISEYTRNVPPQVRAARMLGKPVRDVRYVITTEGPVPVQLEPTAIDYKHYIQKQLAPIAEAVLPLVGLSFDEIAGSSQMRLF